MIARLRLPLRLCMPRVRKRGYGLGNELIPWARAHLAAQVLEARLLPPAFGLNRRGYWRDFHTSPDDWIYHRALQQLLPVVAFTETDYLEHGGGDALVALRSFVAARRLQERSVVLLVTEGMWGGFNHVSAARDFVRTTLQRSRYAPDNLATLRERVDPAKVLVGMHVRLGDFRPPGAAADYGGAANISLPMAWFQNVAASLQQAFGEQWQLLLVSDGPQEAMRELLDAYPCVITGDLAHCDCSDALALAGADLLVCSISSYSLLAAYLTDAPYLWFAPNLVRNVDGSYVVPIAAAGQDTRGVAVGLDGTVPQPVLAAALQRSRTRNA